MGKILGDWAARIPGTRPRLRVFAASVLALGAGSLFALSCSKSQAPEGAPAASGVSASSAAPAPAPGTSAGAAASANAPAAPESGPVVTIPAGKLVAGTPCGEHPRLPSEEPAGVSVDLGEFTIDAYPYPNSADKPPLVNVTQSEAKAFCEARGRRLCTELEWERACKGPSNTKYEYGNRFDGKKCPAGTGPLGPAGSHEGCKSVFGVNAMHGFVWEWTASAWGRGKEGDSVALRGGFGSSPYAHMRCSAAKEAPPGEKGKATGFRCCGGPENSAKVDLPAAEEDLAAFEAVDPPEDALVARLGRALKNGQMKEEPGVVYTFEKVWRWRPVKNEELFVARYAGKPGGDGAAFVQPVVVQLCDRSALLLSRLRGPVEEIGEPQADEKDPSQITLSLKSGADAGEVRFGYRFGQVNVTQPAWVKEGAVSPSASDAGAPDASAAAPGGK